MTQVYDWDMAEVDDAGESAEIPVLQPGTYPFEVAKLEKEHFDGSAKAPAGPRAHLTLKLDGGSQGTGFAHERILLNEKSAWRIATLFDACGYPLNANGHRIIDWGTIEGKTGECSVKVTEYNGVKRNEVNRFISAKPEGNVGW